MAINFRELDQKLNNDPLSKEELKIVGEVENYIDHEIKRQYDGLNYVHISNDIIAFDWNPSEDCHRSLPYARKKKMKEAILKMYREQHWDVQYEGGEDDGPNRPGRSEWIFKGIGE